MSSYIKGADFFLYQVQLYCLYLLLFCNNYSNNMYIFCFSLKRKYMCCYFIPLFSIKLNSNFAVRVKQLWLNVTRCNLWQPISKFLFQRCEIAQYIDSANDLFNLRNSYKTHTRLKANVLSFSNYVQLTRKGIGHKSLKIVTTLYLCVD